MGCGLGEENNIQIETEEGRNSDNTEEISEYIDLLSETEPLYDIGNAVMESDGKFRAPRSLGVQFYKGEPVQLWALQDRESGSVDIYLYRQDGSRDLLFDHMSEDSFFGQGYLDEKRNYYHWQNDLKRGVLTKTLNWYYPEPCQVLTQGHWVTSFNWRTAGFLLSIWRTVPGSICLGN